jgi:hypothetical protein
MVQEEARVADSPLAFLAATALVLPLFSLEVWSGFRIAASDSILSAIAVTEQPLSVRSPAGVWAIGLALLWFAIAYGRRRAPLWQAALVLLGGVAVLLRTGNAWLDGLALIVPLGAQLSSLRLRPIVLCTAAAFGMLVAAATLWTTRPPVLPPGAVEAAQAAHGRGTVFADWRWAPDLQRDLPRQNVLASGGIASETPDFWLDYVRIVQDYEQWPAELNRLNVNLLVLDRTQSGFVDEVRASRDWQVVYDSGLALVAERAAA